MDTSEFIASDSSITQMIGAFIKHHRLNQNKSQAAVAKAAGMSRSTLSLMERGEKVALNSLLRVLRVLDLLYILDVFKVEERISPIEYVKLNRKKRQRASGKPFTYIVEEEDIGW